MKFLATWGGVKWSVVLRREVKFLTMCSVVQWRVVSCCEV